MRSINQILLSVGIVFLLMSSGYSQPRLSLSLYAQGFSEPVESTHAGDDRLFVVERRGQIRIVDGNGQVLSSPFLNIQALVNDSEPERGLLGLAFPADYSASGRFYICYTNQSGDVVVARYLVSASPDVADPTSAEILMTYDQPFANHNGGCLRIGPDGMLYIGIGDGGAGGDPGDRSQKIQNPLGAIHRIDVSGASGFTVPADNPFVGVFGAIETIWAYGLRNPWKISYDQENADLWIADVGQDAREEINRMAGDSAGVNYGWRCKEGVASFNMNNCNGVYTDPVWDYQHGSSTGESVTGGFVYRGEDYPELLGHYVFGDYVSGNVWTLFPNGNGGYDTTRQGELVSNGQLTSFGIDQRNELYLLTKSGAVYQVQSSPTSIFSPNHQQVGVQYMESGVVEINWPQQSGLALIEILDVTGKLVRYLETTEDHLELSPALLPGIYILRVTAGAGYSGKVVIR